jgi:hypothetical protein
MITPANASPKTPRNSKAFVTSISYFLVCALTSRYSVVTKFSPDYLISDFSTEAIQRYTNEYTRGFTGQILNVVVTWGEGTLKLRASPFIIHPNGIMQKTYYSQDGRLLGVESLPVGLTEASMGLLE